MKSSMLRKAAVIGAFVAATVMPTAAFADEGYYYFNDGQGTCGYMQETPYGWQVIMTFPCPREVSGG